MRVLLVADHPSTAAQVRTALLGVDDLDILHVRTPQRALALLEEGQVFDVVVGDNDTHPTGGFALAREVKARGQMGEHAPPVVLLLARIQDQWLSNWSQADAFVIKPADPFDLQETVLAVADGKPVPALPGVGGKPTPSLLDRPPERDLPVGRPDQVGRAT